MTKSTAKSGLFIRPNKNRLKQATRTGGRKLFDARRKAIFLEWFAATCNVKLSAEQADICYHTAFKHRREDSAFAEAWDEGGGGMPRTVLRASGARLATMRRWATAQQAVVERSAFLSRSTSEISCILFGVDGSRVRSEHSVNGFAKLKG